MRIKRHKKFERHFTFYKQQFHFRAPYQVLVDGTFANAALIAKVNMREQFPKYFEGPCKLMTTPCVLIETELLGPELYGAVQILKGLQLYKCHHGDKPLQAAACLKSIVRKNAPRKKKSNDSEDNHFVLATQDQNLRMGVRELVGVPLLYLHGSAPTLEKPSDDTVAWTEKRDKKRLEISKYQKEILQHIKDDVLPGSSGPVKKGTRKRKRAGPNPLSCKKSKKKKVGPPNGNQSGGSRAAEEDDQPKKKRKRIKVKIPKHVRELKSNT